MAVQTELSLPQMVDAFWHCCPSSVTIVGKGKETGERVCSSIGVEDVGMDDGVDKFPEAANDSEDIFHIHGEAHDEVISSAN